MSGRSLKLGDKKKSDFYNNKKPFNTGVIDVDIISISKKESCGENKAYKYVIGYNYNDEIKHLFIAMILFFP